MFTIGIALIVLLFQTLDYSLIDDKLREMPQQELFFYLGLLFLIQLLIMLLSAFKWRVVLRNSDVSMKNIIPATLVGYLINNITPVGLAGGEPIRAYILYKTDKVDMPTAASSVIMDLFLEIFPIFLIIVVSLGIVVSMGVPMEITLLLIILSLILFILFVTVVSIAYNKSYSIVFMRFMSKIISILPFFKKYSSRLNNEFDEIVSRFDRAMRLQLLDNQIIIQGVSFSMAVWTLRMIRLYVCFKALGIIVSFPTVVVVETMVSAVSFLPLLPGSLGIWEWTSVELFNIISNYSGIYVTREYAAMATILNRVFFYLIPSIIGVLSALYLGVSITKIADNSKKELKA